MGSAAIFRKAVFPWGGQDGLRWQRYRYTSGRMFVVCRLQRMGRESRPWDMCFINLQTTYDSVGRMLLWDVLTRFGVPPWIIKMTVSYQNDSTSARRGSSSGAFCSRCVQHLFATVIRRDFTALHGRPEQSSQTWYSYTMRQSTKGNHIEDIPLERMRCALWGTLLYMRITQAGSQDRPTGSLR